MAEHANAYVYFRNEKRKKETMEKLRKTVLTKDEKERLAKRDKGSDSFVIKKAIKLVLGE